MRERDNRSLVPTPPNAAQTPNSKKIYKIDLNTPVLTDVSDVASLPAGALGGIVPASKTLFADLLDASYKVNTTQTVKDVIAEKVEGMANDFHPGRPTQIFAFAVDGAAAGIAYEPQRVHGPMFPRARSRRR